MAEILVSGYYGFYNAGDEAILAGMIRSIRELLPDASFTVISGKAAWSRALHGVKAVSRDDFKHIWQAIGQADMVISGGGTLLQDVTSSKSLTYYLGIMTMGKLRRKPVMIYAQGAGPVTRLYGRTMIPAVVNRVDTITVRDPESEQTMRALGVHRPPITVTADPALALGPADPELGGAFLKEAGVDLSRPVIGVSVRPWKRSEGLMEPPLAEALDQLARETGGQVVFLPMQRTHDVHAAEAVAARMQHRPVLIQGDLTYTQVQAMVARCSLMIGMRYHALVFAAQNGVPVVGLSYDPKNDSFLQLIGERVTGHTWSLEAGAVVASAREALADAPAIRRRLEERMTQLIPLARKNAELAIELLNQRGTK